MIYRRGRWSPVTGSFELPSSGAFTTLAVLIAEVDIAQRFSGQGGKGRQSDFDHADRFVFEDAQVGYAFALDLQALQGV